MNHYFCYYYKLSYLSRFSDLLTNKSKFTQFYTLDKLDDPNRIKKLLGKTANLSFRLVSEGEEGFGSDLVEMETEHSNPDNPGLSKFAEEYAEWSKDKVISKKLKGFNRLLRNYTWTIPYIGIHYQGGKSQKIEPMLR